MTDIVIHGASSFIGKNLLRNLQSRNFRLIVLARENSKIDTGDSDISIIRYNRNIDEIDPAKIHADKPVFFEFCWQGVFGDERNQIEQITVNIPLIINSVRFANSIGVKHWIGLGSQAEYGNLNKRISEEDVCRPTSLYGKAKLISSDISASLCRHYQIEHSWLRLFSVYGPEDNHDWLIPYLVKTMKRNGAVNVTMAEQYWDYLYIDDMIQALKKLVFSKGIGIVNIGSGKSVQIRTIIERLKTILKSGSTINYGAVSYQKDQVMFMEADISRISGLLNWEPEFDIEMGLTRMLNQYIEVHN